jgi:Predicted permease.
VLGDPKALSLQLLAGSMQTADMQPDNPGMVGAVRHRLPRSGRLRPRLLAGLTERLELSALTKVELGFALILAAATSGLTPGLGFHERRRTFAIASALGARSHQLGGFVWSESAFVTGGGLILGAVMASGLSIMLVKVPDRGVRPPA